MLDVTDWDQTYTVFMMRRPDVVFHLAGAKHAPEGEKDPLYVNTVNVTGTANVLRAAQIVGAKVITASTCKAADPETAYGASKLIAERMTLNAGGVVVRYYNVRETAGNVFRIWESIPESEPIPWTNSYRFFITLRQALDLTLAAMDLPTGRYTIDPARPTHMKDEAARLYPGRDLVEIPRRRGDRAAEPLKGRGETWFPHGEFLRITSPHDPQ